MHVMLCAGKRPRVGRTARGPRPPSAAASKPTQVQHLVIESNGLFGYPQNWEVMNRRLRSKLNQEHYIIHASTVNQLSKTFDGIDVCGDRLRDEIIALTEQHPSLKYISMLGHSMGGLMLRYAAGQLYDPATGLVARLEPAHFITMATPHMGCDVHGESKVPFFGYVTPILTQSMADSVFPTLGQVLFKRTGQQFFLEDHSPRPLSATTGDRAQLATGPGSVEHKTPTALRSKETSRGVRASAVRGPPEWMPQGVLGHWDSQTRQGYSRRTRPGVRLSTSVRNRTSRRSGVGASRGAISGASHEAVSDVRQGTPLLARMAFDVPGDGWYYSALQAFYSRTCYGNVCDDQLVGWSNSTLRYADELPRWDIRDRVENPQVKGVIREDPLDRAWGPPLSRSPSSHPLGSRVATSAQPGAERSVLRDALAQAVGRRSGDNLADSSPKLVTANAQQATSRKASEPEARREVPGANSQTQGDDAAMAVQLQQMPGMPRAAMAAVVLARLRSVPWSRVDCAWRDATVSVFAHNNIQGESVCEHLADRFIAMEQQLSQSRPEYLVPPMSTTRSGTTDRAV